MCGGGGSKYTPAPAPAGPMYAPADASNRQRQAAAIETDSGARAASFGGELGTATTTGGK